MALLERALELMSEDESIQPAVKSLYATIREAESRMAVLEDWYRRTYGAIVASPSISASENGNGRNP